MAPRNSNQGQVLRVSIGEYMGFGSMVGPDSYNISSPP